LDTPRSNQTKEKINYEVGISKYKELAKGQMHRDEQGMSRSSFCPTTFKILGVHIIGDRAAEIVHIGQAAMSLVRPFIFPPTRSQLSNARRSVTKSPRWMD